ncbi:MAG: hypothetical protein Tsb0013_05710 [Phycisphaerales bacterium]
MFRTVTTVTLSVCALTSAAHADLLASWSFDTGSASPDFAASGVTVSDFFSANGATGSASLGHWNAGNWSTSSFDARYTGFTITADAGKEVTLESFDNWNWWWDGASSSGQSGRLIIEYPGGDWLVNLPGASGVSGGGQNGRDDDFPDIVLQPGESATFKWQAEGRSGGVLNLDEVRINGSVVPTPGSAALLAVAGVLGLRRRRA